MTKTIIARMLGYLRPYKAYLAAAFVSALLSVPLGLLGPVLIGQAIDGILGEGQVDFQAVARALCLFAGALAGSSALSWVMRVFTQIISSRAAQDMRRDAFNRINSVPLARIDNHQHGDLVSRLVNDADAVAEGYLQAISQLLPGIVTVVATIVVMCVLNLWIALVVIVVTPLSILFARFVGVRTGRYFRDQGEAQGKLSGYVNEMVGNLPLVQAMGYEAGSAQAFAEFTNQYYEANFKATLYSSVINPGARLVNAIVYAAVAVFGALYAIAGGITVGGLSAFLSYANQYTRPFNEITAVLTQMQSALASASRLFEVIDWEAERPDPEGLVLTSAEGHVTTSRVFFSYDKSKPLIQDCSLEALPGKRIALVGPTGCGKTTLINLLMRFYEIDSGEITVDGVRADQITRDSLRSRFGMVLQDTWLKQATISENIAYARPDATREEIVAAAKTAFAHSFIKRLPNGYDTVLDAGGGNLSAGQRQLLCIARIVLAQPDMLILDEATSSIDTRTESALQLAIENLMSGHTSFIVAHRLSTIQNADMILVMDAGRIIERGTHDQLLASGGFYAGLFMSQFARD